MNLSVSTPLSKVGSVAGTVAKSSTFQVILGVLVVLGFVYYVGRKAGANDVPTVDYPNKGKGLPDGWQAQAEGILTQCYEVLTGTVVFSGAKDELFNTLLGLSDDQLTYLYNAWNARYFKKYNESLTATIENEIYYDYTTGLKARLVNRMKALKLA